MTARPVDVGPVKKVLVVDDSETIRDQVRKALTDAGYDVVEACDGLEALDRLRATPDVTLLLCDVNMPRMTGIDFLAKTRDQGVKVPIVMLTSEGQPSLIRRARELGAAGWIVKPFKTEQLLSAVSRLVVA